MSNKNKDISKWLAAGSINVFGRPFAGKDTQGLILANIFDGALIAGGDILRHYHDQEKVNKIMSTGELFPTNLYLEIVLPFLSQDKFHGKPLILSSVGRMVGEEQTIFDATKKSGHETKAVVVLNMSEDEVWRRFEAAKLLNDRGNRADDKKDALATRLKEFQQKTVPVIDFYKKLNLVIEVDGTLPLEDVTSEILNALTKRAQA